MNERDFAELRVVVENPAGSTRFWHDREGRVSGSTKMKYDYGFLAGYAGADGDAIDCYLGPNEAAKFVYVVHQLKSPDFKAFDEDKCFLGFNSEADAKSAYLAHRNDGDRAYGGMSAIPLEAFKAKLERRTGTGKIRHEAPMTNAQMFRIEHRGSKWVVLPETGNHVLGEHDTKEEAEAQLRAIEASKARSANHAIAFDSARGMDGKVRVGVWDRVCVPGHDEKDGQTTEFTLATLSQMIDNFVDRGDPIPLDYNHQSNLVAQNGKPAPALAWYGALAVVWGGQVIKLGCANGVAANGTEPGLDGRDGLWCFRSEVTEIGDQLLPNFKLLSPTFVAEGTKRDGTPCGYCLMAVAATNTPWQPATQITFSNLADEIKRAVGDAFRDVKIEIVSPAGAAGSTQEGRKPMKLAMLAAFLTEKYGIKFDAEDGDPEVKKKALSKMDDEAAAAMGAPKFNYDEAAGHFEEMAKRYEDAHMEESEGEEPAHITMRRMAANFRRMAKMGDPPFGGKETPSEEKAEEKAAEYQAMSALAASLKARGVTVPEKASRATLMSLAAITPAGADEAKLAKLVDERIKAQREADEVAAKKAEGEHLVKMARESKAPDYEIAGLQALVTLGNMESARAAAKKYEKPGAPAHLFSRLTHQGAPVNEPPGNGVRGAREGRVESSSITKTKSGAVIFSADAGLDAEAQKLFDSKDPVIMSRIDARLSSAGDRANPAFRMFAAQAIAAEMYPDLAEEAERTELALKIGR